jgi:hypothetical protein
MKRIWAVLAAFFCISAALAQPAGAQAPAPTPLASQGHPEKWIFVYKFNATSFPSKLDDPARLCPFGGSPRPKDRFSQQYVYATASDPALRMGTGLVGTSIADPLGATFSEIYNGDYFYVVWNDQFQTPPIPGGGSGTGHSKGILVWNQNGDGLVLQVSTPGWPGAGNVRLKRDGDGNTLGCLTKVSNNLQFAQHFFALKLSPQDVVSVLQALVNSNVVTTIGESAIRHVGGPAPIVAAAKGLGKSNGSVTVTDTVLSSGVRLISKPPALAVPPWQLVSAELTPAGAPNGPDLRTATWTPSTMPETTTPKDPACWGFSRHSGAIGIARWGSFSNTAFKLGSSSNHAKIGVSTAQSGPWYSIFSDLNEDGPLEPAGVPSTCSKRQNGRGGMFFVIDNRALHDGVYALIKQPPASLLPPSP